MYAGQLGPAQRVQTIQHMTEQIFDVVVIGGGVTGAGTALDAVGRGLSVALLEAQDLASGTSSRSGKTFHGGLRYLQQLNFPLVRQASHERNLMIDRLCPHLAWPTPFLFPLQHRGWERLYMGSGVLLYDLIGGARPAEMPRHRHLSKTGALHAMPSLHSDRVIGALQYYDAIFDDARHTLTVARTAAHYGALIGTRLKVIGMLREGQRIVGVQVHDQETNQEFAVRGRCVINATGAWADLVQGLSGEAQIEIRPAKGVHIVVSQDKIVSHTGFIAPTADSVLVIRPWGRYWIIGTTDTPWDYDRADPLANRSDINYLLHEVNTWLQTPLTRNDIIGVYTGIRPLLSRKGKATAALSREHNVLEGPAGLFTITGGKYTTYRVMARDVMDAAARSLDRSVPASMTEQTPLLGAASWQTLRNQQQLLAKLTGLEPHAIDHLLKRYGSLVSELFDLLTTRPELAQPITGAPDYLAVEAVYAASHEGILHLDDLLARRTHIAIETRDRGLSAAEPCARLIGEILGWDNTHIDQEIVRYKSQVETEGCAENAPTDAEAIEASNWG